MSKIKSYYINVRKRWHLIPRVWNKFFSNLKDDYDNLKLEIDSHDINDNETNLRDEMDEIIKKLKRS